MTKNSNQGGPAFRIWLHGLPPKIGPKVMASRQNGPKVMNPCIASASHVGLCGHRSAERATVLGRFCKPNRFDFRKGPRQGFDRAGSKYTRTCANRKFVLQTENLFSVSFSVRPVPMAKRLGTFKKILAETLLLSSHKVTKWSWRGRTSFFTLACFARQCGARSGTDNQRGSSRTVLHEGE